MAWCITGGCANDRGILKGFNGLDLGIRFSSGRIYEGTHKHVENMENESFWGYCRGSDGMVAELHRIRDLLRLIIMWDDMLSAIMIQVHTNNPYLLASKVPIIVIGCLPRDHDWKNKGSELFLPCNKNP